MNLSEALAVYGITHEAESLGDFGRGSPGRYLRWNGRSLGCLDVVQGWTLVALLSSITATVVTLDGDRPADFGEPDGRCLLTCEPDCLCTLRAVRQKETT